MEQRTSQAWWFKLMTLGTVRNMKDKGLRPNPDLVPYHHDPPGHTCGLPCCSEDLRIALRVRSNRPKSCIAFQGLEVLQENFTLNNGRQFRQGGSKLFENGFYSVQQSKESRQRRTLPEFGSVRGNASDVDSKRGLCQQHFLKGREITLPEWKDIDDNDGGLCGSSCTDPSEKNDVLKLESDNEIDYYMTVTIPNTETTAVPGRGVPYTPQHVTGVNLYPWELMMEMKLNANASAAKSDAGSSTNYYDVLHFPDEPPAFKRSEKPKKVNFHHIVEITSVDNKTTLQPVKIKQQSVPLPKPPVQEMSTFKSSGQVESKSISSIKSNTSSKFNTYTSMHSIASKLDIPECIQSKHMSLDRHRFKKDTIKSRIDAREIDFKTNWKHATTWDLSFNTEQELTSAGQKEDLVTLTDTNSNVLSCSVVEERGDISSRPQTPCLVGNPITLIL